MQPKTLSLHAVNDLLRFYFHKVLYMLYQQLYHSLLQSNHNYRVLGLIPVLLIVLETTHYPSQTNHVK